MVKSDNPINKTEISKLEKHNQFLTSLFNKFYSKNIEIIQNNIREMREQYKDLKIILKQLKRDLKVSIYEFNLDNIGTTEATAPEHQSFLDERRLQEVISDMIYSGAEPIIYAGQDPFFNNG